MVQLLLCVCSKPAASASAGCLLGLNQLIWYPVQVLLAVAWVIVCTLSLSASLPALPKHAKAVLWTFYQPLVPPLLMLWLWAHNVAVFENRHIPYASCFAEQDKRFCPTHSELLRVSAAAGECSRGRTQSSRRRSQCSCRRREPAQQQATSNAAAAAAKCTTSVCNASWSRAQRHCDSGQSQAAAAGAAAGCSDRGSSNAPALV